MNSSTGKRTAEDVIRDHNAQVAQDTAAREQEVNEKAKARELRYIVRANANVGRIRKSLKAAAERLEQAEWLPVGEMVAVLDRFEQAWGRPSRSLFPHRYDRRLSHKRALWRLTDPGCGRWGEEHLYMDSDGNLYMEELQSKEHHDRNGNPWYYVDILSDEGIIKHLDVRFEHKYEDLISKINAIAAKEVPLEKVETRWRKTK